jgi:hypothetical protein
MSRVKVKKIKMPIGKDEDIAEMFNQMLGAGSINMTIAWPRYRRIKSLVENLVKLFEMLNKSPFMEKNTNFANQRSEISKFCASAQTQIEAMFAMDFSDYEWNLNLVEEDLKTKFSEAYDRMKKSDLINTFVIMCSNLAVYKKYISDVNKLNHKFITSMAGAEWSPFPFTALNLKQIFSLDNIGENTIRFFMVVLNKAFELGYQLYKEISSPDVDVDQFVEIIMNSMNEIQKRPELSRCRKAFQKIKESVNLLKDKFGNYYRDFISTKDSTIIMQHFIIDVSKSADADTETTRQFRQIINYYRKIAQEQITNPRVKMLFDRVNESFKELERGAENLVNIRDDDSEDSDSDQIEVTADNSQ